MNKIRTLVVDDEPLAGRLIASYVEKTPFLELASLCLDGVSALGLIEEGRVDLVFCDIQMPDLTGMELSRMVSSPQVKFIFTTAYAQYAIDGYKVSALDYLLKPVSYKDFLESANRAKAYFDALRETPAKEAGKESLFLKVDGQMVKVSIDDILYVESVKDYALCGRQRPDVSGQPEEDGGTASSRQVLPSPAFVSGGFGQGDCDGAGEDYFRQGEDCRVRPGQG